MADFYKTTPTNDPNWLGQSKEPDRVRPNTSMGELFEGIGNIGSKAIQATDSLIKEGIKRDAHELIDPIQAQHGSAMSPEEVVPIAGTGAKGRVRALQMRDGALTQDDDTSSALGYGPEDAKRDFDRVDSIFPVNDKRPLPPQAEKEISQLERFQKAYYAGKMSDSYYNSQLVSVAKQLRAQYPGYRDEVDTAISQITGVQPANALRSSLQRDIQANLAAQMAGATSDQKFIEKHRGVIYALGYNDNTPIDVLKPAVGNFLGNQTVLKAKELEVSVGSPEAESLLSTKLGRMSTGSLVSMSNKAQGAKPLADFEAEARELSLKGGGSPKEQAELARRMEFTMNSLKVQMRQAAYLPIEGDREGRTLVGKVKDGDQKLDSIIEAQLRPWKEGIALVKSGQMSALQVSTDSLKYEDNLDMQNLRRAFPSSRIATAINNSFPNNPLIANQFLTRSKILPEFGKAIESGLGNAILNGSTTTPAPKPSEAVGAYGPELGKTQTDEIYKRTAKQYDIVLSSENKNTENAKHVAQQFFTDYKFYDNLSDGGRAQLFLRMAAPSKGEFIKSLGPEAFAAYKEWSMYAAGDIYRRSADNLQAVLTDPRYNVSFNPKDMVFVDNTRYDAEGRKFSATDKSAVTRPLNAINNAITYLRPIVGDDMNAILPALGVNPLALKEDYLASQMVRAIGGALMKGAQNAKNVVTQGAKEAAEGLEHARIKGKLEAGEDPVAQQRAMEMWGQWPPPEGAYKKNTDGSVGYIDWTYRGPRPK
jgi:hypothetical protein